MTRKKAAAAEPTEPWERRDQEPGDQHAAFRIFRDMLPGERTLPKVARAIRKSEAIVRRWAKQWDWWERCQAWDDECNKLTDAERLAQIQEMQRKHAEAGQKAIDKALDAIDNMSPADLTGPAAVRLLEFGIKMQRAQIADVDDDDEADPWEDIARALDPANVT